jgi:hypothetical protein
MAFLASAITERVSKSESQEKETAKFCRLKGARWGECTREPGCLRPGWLRLAGTLTPPCAGFLRQTLPSRPDSCLAHVLAGTSLSESFRPL